MGNDGGNTNGRDTVMSPSQKHGIDILEADIDGLGATARPSFLAEPLSKRVRNLSAEFRQRECSRRTTEKALYSRCSCESKVSREDPAAPSHDAR